MGGVDISTVDPETLLKDYAIVFQDVVLFNDTIMGNIRLGRKDATDEEVMAAARAASAMSLFSVCRRDTRRWWEKTALLCPGVNASVFLLPAPC